MTPPFLGVKNRRKTSNHKSPKYYILCHTFAAHYLQANPDDLRGLAALLGHSDLNTAMIYTEPPRFGGAVGADESGGGGVTA
jgi:site-specific recombinase XerC